MNDLFMCGEDSSLGYTLKAQQLEFDLQIQVYGRGWRWHGGLCLKIQPSGREMETGTHQGLTSQPA